MVISEISAKAKNSFNYASVSASDDKKTVGFSSSPINLSEAPSKVNKSDKVDMTKEEALREAKGQALGDLMSDIEIKPAGKPVVNQLGGLLQTKITELQGVVNTYMNQAGKLILEKQSLDPKDPASEKRSKEIDNEIKKLKDEAKPKLEKVYCYIYAMEEASEILFATFGKEKANTVNLDNFTQNIAKLFESQNASPKEIKNQIDKLLKDSEELHPDKKKKEKSSAEADSYSFTSKKSETNKVSTLPSAKFEQVA